MIGDIMTKTQFPKGFLWGASTSAFQIEGGFDEGGKGPATTDIFPSIHSFSLSIFIFPSAERGITL